jgi:hypothetical protein
MFRKVPECRIARPPDPSLDAITGGKGLAKVFDGFANVPSMLKDYLIDECILD